MTNPNQNKKPFGMSQKFDHNITEFMNANFLNYVSRNDILLLTRTKSYQLTVYWEKHKLPMIKKEILIKVETLDSSVLKFSCYLILFCVMQRSFTRKARSDVCEFQVVDVTWISAVNQLFHRTANSRKLSALQVIKLAPTLTATSRRFQELKRLWISVAIFKGIWWISR